MDNLTEMLKGVLEGCVLEIIGREETYGYEITRKLNALGFADVVEGTVYTILLRLEKNRLVDTCKKPSEVGPPHKIQHYMWSHVAGDGMDMTVVLADLVDLFEQGAADGKRVLEVTGEDVAAFCDDLLANTKTYAGTKQEAFNRAIMGKLGKDRP